MKILSIRGRNLNSLRGDFGLDFTTDAFAGGGLFAITGPTGAGKTTLLDAITLALYGCTPRQDAGAALMSYGTGESWAEVVYEVGGERYRARWEQARARRKPGGNLQEPAMEVSRVADGKVLTQKKREAEKLNEQLTGLKVDQFTRAVLLAQGQFTQFLKAPANERARLLERMTGTDRYRTLSVAAYEAWKEQAEETRKLEARLGGVALLPKETVAALRADLAALEARVTQAAEAETSAAREHQWHERRAEQTRKVERARAEVLRAEGAEEAAGPELERLAAHEAAAPCGPAAQAAGQAAARARELEEEVGALAVQLQEATTAQTAAAEAVRQATAVADEARRALESAEPDLLAAVAEAAALAQEHTTLERARAGMAQSRQLVREREAALQDLRSRTARAREEFGELEAWRQANEYLAGLPAALGEAENSVRAWAESRAGQQRLTKERQAQEATVRRLQDELVKLTQQQRAAEAAALSLEKEMAEAGQLHAALQRAAQLRQAEVKAHLLAAQEQAEQARELLAAKQLIASHAELRAALKPGGECPVCGATEHPFVAAGVDVSESALGRLAGQVRERERAVEAVRGQAQQLTEIGATLAAVDVAAGPAGLEGVGADAADLTAEAARRVVGTLQAGPRRRAEIAGAREQLTQQREHVGARLVEAEQAVETLGRQLAEQVESELAAREALAMYEATYRNLFDESRPTDFSAALRKAAELWTSRDERHRRLAPGLEKAAALLEVQQEEIGRLTAGLEQQVAEQRAVEESLQARAALVRARHPGHATPEAALAELRQRATASADACTAAVARQQAVLTAAGQAHTAHGAKMQELDRARGESARADATLQSELAAAGLPPDPAGLAARLLPEAERERLTRRRTAVREAVTTARALAEAATQELAATEAAGAGGIGADALTARSRWEEAKAYHEGLREEMGARRQQLAADEAARGQLAGLEAALEAQRREASRWKELYELIGSHDGKKFSEFAQSLTLERLTGLANQHLRYLCDRYRLRRYQGADDKRQLDLLVVDRYQADNEREVSTLSGGESFLVSLALALGLAELASSATARLDSLFIDEGFGTLDAEALDVALSGLENLQARGKLVGVISHVEVLKERIPVQVAVERGPDGFSTLRVTPEARAGEKVGA